MLQLNCRRWGEQEIPPAKSGKAHPGKPDPTMLQWHSTPLLYPNTHVTRDLRKTTLSHYISVLGCDNYHLAIINLPVEFTKSWKWGLYVVNYPCRHQLITVRYGVFTVQSKPVQMSMSAEIGEFYKFSSCFCTVQSNIVYHTVLSSAGTGMVLYLTSYCSS